MDHFSENERVKDGASARTYAPRAPFFDYSEPRLGVLNPQLGKDHFRLLRYDPAPELANFVRHYWTVEWDLGGAEHYQQEVVPNPCVNLVIEPGRTACYMPSTSRFSYRLQEAAEALDRSSGQGTGPKLLHLSHDLGYHDQAHFIKDFKAVIGVTPEVYASGARR